MRVRVFQRIAPHSLSNSVYLSLSTSRDHSLRDAPHHYYTTTPVREDRIARLTIYDRYSTSLRARLRSASRLRMRRATTNQHSRRSAARVRYARSGPLPHRHPCCFFRPVLSAAPSSVQLLSSGTNQRVGGSGAI